MYVRSMYGIRTVYVRMECKGGDGIRLDDHDAPTHQSIVYGPTELHVMKIPSHEGMLCLIKEAGSQKMFKKHLSSKLKSCAPVKSGKREKELNKYCSEVHYLYFAVIS